MRGGRRTNPGIKTGFTIVEVMIFLAVSGLTFLIAAAFISGKEGQAEFTSGMNDANQAVRSIIDDVVNGNYPLPSSNNVSCSANPSGPVVSPGIGSPSATPPGQSGCTFIGIVLVPGGHGNVSDYQTYPVVGCQFSQCSSTTFLPQSIYQEKPTYSPLFVPATNNWNGNFVHKIIAINSSGKIDTTITTGAVGIFGALPRNNGLILQSVAQTAVLAYFPGTSLTSFDPVKDTSQATILPADDYFVLCFTGANGNNASISIGSQYGGGQLTTSLGMAQKAAPQC